MMQFVTPNIQRVLGALGVFGWLVALLLISTPARAGGPLETAIADTEAETETSLQHVRAAGANQFRVVIPWNMVAKRRPTDPTNPGDPAYRWQDVDTLMVRVVAAGLEPLVLINGAPGWAQGRGSGPLGTVRPDPIAFGRFAQAAARRYSGSFAGLPRVRNWEAWNEPNTSFFFNPQYQGNRAVSPKIYRRMVVRFAAGVHAVRSDNVVIAGATFPFKLNRPNARAVAPLSFMRSVFCLSKKLRAKHKCGPPLHIDVWSHHPFTSGGPTHKARSPGSVSLGDLPKMRRVLRAAVRSKRVVSDRSVRLWITEFSWDTNPPDSKGVPLQLHARWVSEALYRAWRSGVSLVTWWTIRDRANNGLSDPQTVQSGLFFRCKAGESCDRPKPSLQAFRFPFVAFKSRGRVLVWGRTPHGRPARVRVERSSGGKWKRIATLRTNRYGIFSRRLRTSRRGKLIARLADGSETSVPFSLKRPPDRKINPFG